MPRLKWIALSGVFLFVACLVVGFIPTHADDGRNCGSVLGPGRRTSQICRDVREGWVPFVIALLALAVVLLLWALVLWWRRAKSADEERMLP